MRAPNSNELEKLREIIKYFVSTSPAVDRLDSESLLIIWKFGAHILNRSKKAKYKNMKEFLNKAYGKQQKMRG